MISNQQILGQIEKQLQAARQNTNDQLVRESLAAIKALCELALDSSPRVDVSQAVSSPRVEMSHVISSPKVAEPSTGTRVQEEDANGDSIFDF